MSKLQLAVAARDKEYVRRLADYIRGSSFAERWQVTAFTSANSCKQYMKQGFGIDVIAAEKELAAELRDHAGSKPVVILVDRLSDSVEDRELLQYQSLPLFMGALEEMVRNSSHMELQAIGRQGHRNQAEGLGGAGVVAVHSAAGGVGKTTIALHLASAAGVIGLRACYLNMERWDTSNVWLASGGKEGKPHEGLSDLLYRVKSGSSSNGGQIAKYCQYSPLLKCDYVPGFCNPEDRITLSGEDALTLVDAIAFSGRYDLVVLDLDDGWAEPQLSLLERSGIVYEVVKDDRSVIGKQQQAMRYARQMQGERYGEVLNRSQLVFNGSRMEADGRDWRTMFGVRETPVWLPEVPEWRDSGSHRPLTSSAYLAAACKLLKQSLKEGENVRAAG
ncbi:hypothetical protein RB620_12825 [Paenibacillus sp. LHD-117]|uniref:hypothetical protein n=1 Tax=Paenibacillus sp. LHD-117 TaxID=3071412 RepID=UPI0027DEE186|nr:hypothetical protein [Paenibacillus sp. LHD-117]MDQ6420320.1 hypothetical protein [Paenibacillus sp. LHD-117]